MTSHTSRRRAAAALTTLALAAGLTAGLVPAATTPGALSDGLSDGLTGGMAVAHADTPAATSHAIVDPAGDQQVLGQTRQPRPDIVQVTYSRRTAGVLKVTVQVNNMRKIRRHRLREEYSVPVLIDGDHLYTIGHTRTWQPTLMHNGTGQVSTPAGATVRRSMRRHAITFVMPTASMANTDDAAVGAVAVLRRGVRGPWLSADYVTAGPAIALR